MTVEKSPAMPLYGKDIYTDERVLRLSYAHQGLYVRLLWWQWSEGSIPSSIKSIVDMIGKPRDTPKLWKDVKNFFAPHPTMPDRLWNPKLEAARTKLFNHRHPKTRQKSGEKAADKAVNGTAAESGEKAVPIAVASAFASALEPVINSVLPSSSSGGGNTQHGHRIAADRHQHKGGNALWSQKQFQYRADKIADFLRGLAGLRLAPGDEDFDVKFEAEFQMKYDYWIVERDWHLAFFGAVE